jgi:hypothetical protein
MSLERFVLRQGLLLTPEFHGTAGILVELGSAEPTVATASSHKSRIVVRSRCGMYLSDDVFDREGQELEVFDP